MAKNPIEITKPVTKITKQYLYMESAEHAEHITTSQSEMTDESEITKQSVSATDDPSTVSQSATVTTSTFPKNPTTLPQTSATFTSQESEMSSTTEKTTTPVIVQTTDEYTTMDEQTTENTPFRSVSEEYTTMDEQTTGNTPFRSVSEEKTTQYHSTANPLHHLKEEIVVNVDNNTEVFTIPPGEDHEALIFLHDFTHEYTAYLLVEQDLCFVKNISPFMMSPLGFLNILLNPMYFVHEFIVTQTSYIAIPPPLQRLSFGPEIENLCGNSPTFWLEEMDDDEYDTVNVDDLPWMDWGYPDRYIRRKRSADHNEIKNIRFFDADERMHKEKISFGKLAKDK
ncbi:uncharacterized protein [Antedon mediterranea]|uniref:uncharacterized protein isoform X1 n=1 Tax=Antedon mediterranea TaxID=105859 RepID=UPI003AF690D4